MKFFKAVWFLNTDSEQWERLLKNIQPNTLKYQEQIVLNLVCNVLTVAHQ